jgi:hypothetical protein
VYPLDFVGHYDLAIEDARVVVAALLCHGVCATPVGVVLLAMSRGCVRLASKNYGRLLSHAEPNYSGCCATFGPGGSLKGSRTFLANGRNKYFAIIARDSISRPFDVTQSARLPRIALRAWHSPLMAP